MVAIVLELREPLNYFPINFVRKAKCKLTIGCMFSLKKSTANSVKCTTKARTQLNKAHCPITQA